MEEERTRALMRYCILTALLLGLTFVFFKYILTAVLPLLAAVLIAQLVRPVANFISKKSKMPTRVCAVSVLILAVFLISYVGVSAGGKLIREAAELVERTAADLDSEDNIIRRILDIYRTLPERIPFLSSFQADPDMYDKIYRIISEGTKWAAERLSVRVAEFGASVFTGLPDIVFAAVVSIVALFYLTVDAGGVREDMKKMLPPSWHGKLSCLAVAVSGAAGGYFKAYIILLFLTFGELLLGFVLLKVSYPFFAAATVALIDVLPVFGVGAVLVPWAVWLFIKGETLRGVGMLLLFGVMYAVRQFAEPKIIGHLIGIHPLITLAAAYLGYSFFGILGMIVAPITLYVIKEVAEGMGN